MSILLNKKIFKVCSLQSVNHDFIKLSTLTNLLTYFKRFYLRYM